IGGGSMQMVGPSVTIPMPIQDLQHVAPEHKEEQLLHAANAEVRRPFDLTRGPLIRALLLRLPPDGPVFVLSVHHIVTDGWSSGIFIRELCSLYDAFKANEPSPFPDLPLQYAEFAERQQKWLASEVGERQLAYWKERLTGAQGELDLLLDFPRPA